MSASLMAFLSGVIFALGLGISGMTDADKVIAFLDLAGQWDPSLAFVMVGAISVHLVSFRLITQRKSPIFRSDFHIPTSQSIDTRLLVGAGLFGAGWGLAGYCPGPGIVSLVTLGPESSVFVTAMLVAMLVFRFTPGFGSHDASSHGDDG